MWTLLLACTGPPAPPGSAPATEPNGGDSGHSAAPIDDSGGPTTDDTATTTSPELCPTPFSGGFGEDPSFWTEPGPLAPLILPNTLPEGDHWQLRMATSLNGGAWTPDPRVLAIHLSSLSLIETGGGFVINVGVDALNAEPYGVGPPVDSIVVLATQDFSSFATHNLGLLGADTHLPVDASLWQDPDGATHAVYYNYPGEIGSGDPASWPGTHWISTAEYEGGCFVEGPDIYGAEGLLDPMICSRSDGTPWLFATGPAMSIVTVQGTESGFVHHTTWDEYTVPFCMPEGDAVFLVGQTPNGDDGLYTAAIAASDAFVELGALYTEEPFENCTSPVLFRRDDELVLLCAVWTFEEGDPPPPPP